MLKNCFVTVHHIFIRDGWSPKCKGVGGGGGGGGGHLFLSKNCSS